MAREGNGSLPRITSFQNIELKSLDSRLATRLVTPIISKQLRTILSGYVAYLVY